MSEFNELGLPPGWSTSPLGGIAGINPRLDRCVVDDDAEVTFVPMRAVAAEGGGLVSPETRRYGEVKKGYTSFLSGDVIMAKITPCTENGKTTVVPEVPGQVCFGSTEFHTIRPEQGVQAEWIEKFLLQHEARRLAQRSMTGGVGQMRVPGEFLNSVRIPIAPSNEQARIVNTIEELFSVLDGGTASLEKARDKLKLYRASVLKAAVEGALTADWRKRHPQVEPASELLERILVERRRRWEQDQLRVFEQKGRVPPKNWRAKYKEPVARDTTRLPDLPDGWCWVSWGQVGFSQNGRAFPSKHYQESGTELLRPGNLHVDGQVRWTKKNTRYMPDRYLETASTLVVGPGELVINLTAQSLKDDFLGRVCITSRDEFCLLNQRLARLTPIVIPPRFMLWVFKSVVFRKFVSELNTGSLIQHMFTRQLDEFLFPLPPLPEQEAIVEIVDRQLSVIERLEAEIDSKLKKVQGLRQAILRHAFTGRLVPQNPDDEPASELLKRVAAERGARAREARTAQRKKPVSRRRRR